MMRCLKRCTSSNKPVNSPWSSEKPNPVLLGRPGGVFSTAEVVNFADEQNSPKLLNFGTNLKNNYLIFGTWWKCNSKF